MVSKQSGKKDIALTLEFYQWILNKKKGTDKAIEDTLRRLVKYKTRKGTK